MAGQAKPAVALDLPSQLSVITDASSRMMDVLNEAHVDVAKMTKKALSLLLAEESFKVITPRYIATHKDLTMLLRYKDVLLSRLEEECRMLKHVNQKSEYEHSMRVEQVEKLNSKLEQDLLDVRCELVSCQKRLNFALARPPNNMPSSVVEATNIRRMDRYNTAVNEYEKLLGDKHSELHHNKTVVSENIHSRRGKTFDKEDTNQEVNQSSKREGSTPLSKEQIHFLKHSKEKQLPSLLTKDRFPNLPNINVSLENKGSSLNRSVNNQDSRKSRGEKPEAHSRSFLNDDDIFEDRRRLRKDVSKRGKEIGQDSHYKTEEQSNSRNTSKVTDSRPKVLAPGLNNSQKLRDELPLHGDNFHIDYHRFGVIGPPRQVKT